MELRRITAGRGAALSVEAYRANEMVRRKHVRGEKEMKMPKKKIAGNIF